MNEQKQTKVINPRGFNEVLKETIRSQHPWLYGFMFIMAIGIVVESWNRGEILFSFMFSFSVVVIFILSWSFVAYIEFSMERLNAFYSEQEDKQQRKKDNWRKEMEKLQ